jgi:preprotein translocase subunit SecF
MFIIHHRKFFYVLSGILMGLGLLSMVMYAPWNFGIDFTGGALLEVGYPNGRPDATVLRERLDALEWTGTQVQETGDDSFIIRTKDITEAERQQLVDTITDGGKEEVEQRRFSSIGPTIGGELKRKAWMAIALVILAIVLYIAFAFRGVSHPISSWVYGWVAIVALVHDVIIPTGLYVALGHYFIDVQVDALFITAILTILGFSVHDTIVVFDRTRENLKLRTWKEFDTTVGNSIAQTFTRSINTSLTVLLVTLALYFVGGETTKNFALTLGVGILAGTYSSIFLASPLLVTIEEWQRKREASRPKKK